MSNELFSLRTSVRSFRDEDVPREIVDQLLQAAIEAPSAGNLQPWHFYVVRNAQMKEALCAHAYRQTFIQTAPVVIVVCAEPSRSEPRYARRGTDLYCIQDTAAAIENILLCAAGLGLGSCWCGAFDEDAVSRTMGLPDTLRPVAILPIGYGDGGKKKRSRRPLEEVVTYLD